MPVSASSGPTTVRWVALLAAVGILAGLLPLLSTVGAAHFASSTVRFSGENRFDTARLIAADPAYADADTVVIARADDFADALAGALVAGDRGAPLLLTNQDQLPAATVQAITRIAPSTAVILGGSAAISDTVQRHLEDVPSITTVERISGENRYDTARRLAERVGEGGVGTAPPFGGGQGTRVTAVLATGENFPDALAAGGLSAGGRLPLLLTQTNVLSPAARTALGSQTLGIEQVLIVGGTAAVSTHVEAAVRDDIGLPVRRISGPGRTHTASAVAAFTRELLFPLTFVADTVAVANGGDYPDALALGPLAAQRRGTLVITDSPASLSPSTTQFLAASCAGAGAQDAPVLVGGGAAAVSLEVEAQIRDAVVCDDFIGAGDLAVQPATQANSPGATATVTASGTNPKGQPARGARITVEVFRDALALPPGVPSLDARVYRDGVQLFQLVEETTLAAGDDGTVTFTYSHIRAAEDRIVVCTPPRELPHPGCTTQTGDLRIGVPWASVAVRNTWGGGN